MNKFLNLEELTYENKSRERAKLKAFEQILEHCYSQIKRVNKELKITYCKFSIPMYINGYPPFDHDVLVNYLIYHLDDNGLYVKYLAQNNQLLISWNEQDINKERYMQRKQRIIQRQGGVSIPINQSGKQMIIPIKGRGRLFINDPINVKKQRNAQRAQKRRTQLFMNSVDKIKPKKQFGDFMKSF